MEIDAQFPSSNHLQITTSQESLPSFSVSSSSSNSSLHSDANEHQQSLLSHSNSISTHDNLILGYSFPNSTSDTFALEPIYFSSSSSNHQAKPQTSEKILWRWAKFTHPTRSDDLKLSHWTSQPASSPETTPFAIFNTHADVLQYSQEEWEQLSFHTTWTKAETDYLFDMCRQWDLRFTLIADRWDPPIENAPARDMEDLKAQYLRVTHTVLQHRYPFPDPHQKQVLSAFCHFDPHLERERKLHLLELFHRSRTEVQEEMELWQKLLTLEREGAFRNKQRQELLARFYKGLDPHLWASQTLQRCKLREQQWLQQQAPVAPTLPDGVVISSEKKTPGVFLRSAKGSTVKPALQNKINLMLHELHIVSPKMLTHHVFQKYEELRTSILTLINVKKTKEKLEAELAALTKQNERKDSKKRKA